jgi:hypothetical protein
MRKFVGALLLAAASAQATTSSTTKSTLTIDEIKRAASDISGWLIGKTKTVLSTNTQKKEFKLYAETKTTFGLDFSISFDNTALGINFVTVDLHLVGPNANWASGTAQLVYFQIEQPVEAKEGARLLQAATNSTTTSTTSFFSGTGNFEGWSGSIIQPWSSYAQLKTNKNSWGKRSFKTDTTVFTSFGGTDAVTTTSSSAWQLSDLDKQFFFAGNATAPGHWNV